MKSFAEPLATSYLVPRKRLRWLLRLPILPLLMLLLLQSQLALTMPSLRGRLILRLILILSLSLTQWAPRLQQLLLLLEPRRLQPPVIPLLLLLLLLLPRLRALQLQGLVPGPRPGPGPVT